LADYHVRTNINKHLQACSKTIQSAVSKFNRSARALKKPTINIKEVLSQSFLEDFHILCDDSDDITTKDWAKKENRVLRDQYYKLRSAEMELSILNVEIDRVQTWMSQERMELEHAIEKLTSEGSPALASWILSDLREHNLKCAVIVHWLIKCQGLKGYSGKFYHMVESNQNPIDSNSNEEEEEEAVIGSEEAEAIIDEMHDALIRMDQLG
jgi:hypothetical protein